jgi:hypothetical protein
MGDENDLFSVAMLIDELKVRALRNPRRDARFPRPVSRAREGFDAKKKTPRAETRAEIARPRRRRPPNPPTSTPPSLDANVR